MLAEEQQQEVNIMATLSEDTHKQLHPNTENTSQLIENNNSGKSVPRDALQADNQGHAREFAFEELLMKSRVYREAAWDISNTCASTE